MASFLSNSLRSVGKAWSGRCDRIETIDQRQEKFEKLLSKNAKCGYCKKRIEKSDKIIKFCPCKHIIHVKCQSDSCKDFLSYYDKTYRTCPCEIPIFSHDHNETICREDIIDGQVLFDTNEHPECTLHFDDYDYSTRKVDDDKYEAEHPHLKSNSEYMSIADIKVKNNISHHPRAKHYLFNTGHYYTGKNRNLKYILRKIGLYYYYGDRNFIPDLTEEEKEEFRRRKEASNQHARSRQLYSDIHQQISAADAESQNRNSQMLSRSQERRGGRRHTRKRKSSGSSRRRNVGRRRRFKMKHRRYTKKRR